MIKKTVFLLLAVSIMSVSFAQAVTLEDGVAASSIVTGVPVAQPVGVPAVPSDTRKSALPMDAPDVSSNKILITEISSDNVMLEIRATERIKDFTIITLAGPSRLVIEIKNAESRLGERVLINKLGLKYAVLENSPAFLRIILEAEQGRIIPIPYRIQETDTSLNIVITSP